MGCLDSDGDGWSDKTDAYPNDASKNLASEESEEYNITLLGFGIGILVLVFLLIGIMRKKKSSGHDLTFVAPPIPHELPSTPPLPPEGLPEGWTMEQWRFYGEDYLSRNK